MNAIHICLGSSSRIRALFWNYRPKKNLLCQSLSV